MYFLTLLYLQTWNFGASQIVLCLVQLNLSLLGSYVKLFHESKVPILTGSERGERDDRRRHVSRVVCLVRIFLVLEKLIYIFFNLAVWSYLNGTIVVVLEEKNKEKLTFFQI